MNQSGSSESDKSRLRALFRRRVLRFSRIELLCAIVLFIVVAPFIDDSSHRRVIEAVFLSITLRSSVFAVGPRRGTVIVTVLLIVPALGIQWAHHLAPDLIPRHLPLTAGMIFIGYVIANLLRATLRTPRVDLEVLCGAIAAYLLLGILWMLAYSLVGYVSPDAFVFNGPNAADRKMEGFDAFYFSFVTLSTVGYGDVTPVSNVAKMLAITEAVTGMFYVAILIARLVSVYSATSAAETDIDE